MSKGYTKVPNEFLEALAASRLTAREMRIIAAVLRESLGWQRASCALPHARLGQMTGLDGPSVSKVVASLSAQKILLITPGPGRKIGTISLEVNPKKWKTALPPKAPDDLSSETTQKTPPELSLVTSQEPNKLVADDKSKPLHQLDERKKRKKYPEHVQGESEFLRVAKGFHAEKKDKLPKLTKSLNENSDRKGADALEKLIRIEKHDWEYVKNVLRWALMSRDTFWDTELLSLASLRVKGRGGMMKFENVAKSYEKAMNEIREKAGMPERPTPKMLTPEELEARATENPLGKL